MDMTRVEAWVGHLAAKGRKDNTCRTYKEGIKRAVAALEGQGISTAPEDIDADTIIALMGIRSDMTQSSLRIMLWILGAYVEWETGRNPYKEADILWSKGECPNRVFMDAEGLAEADRWADPVTHLILVLGSCMGLRRSEISRLCMTDVLGSRLRVVGKGHGPGKVASMAMPPQVSEAVREWMAIREAMARDADRDESDGALLVYVCDGALRPISAEGVYRRVHRISELSGVPMTPHSLRRRFATGLYEAGVDIVDIKTLMRHESIDTTIECYIRPNDLRLDGIMSGVRM